MSSLAVPAQVPDNRFSRLADDDQLARTVAALRSNGFDTHVVDTAEEARARVLELIPDGASVLDASSQTLARTGVAEEISRSPRFHAVRPELMALAQQGRSDDQRRTGATPDVVVGSVHAVTEAGEIVVASASGSQLAPYAYSAGRVVWVVGSQKIVPDLDTAFERIEAYTFPLENERAQKAYGRGSYLAKLLIVRREFQPGRISVVLVRENLGF